MNTNLTNTPIRATLTRDTLTDTFTIHLQKLGNKNRDVHFTLTDEQVHSIAWWY
jgi:hypothetical protein